MLPLIDCPVLVFIETEDLAPAFFALQFCMLEITPWVKVLLASLSASASLEIK